jgi:hypothetical protein
VINAEKWWGTLPAKDGDKSSEKMPRFRRLSHSRGDAIYERRSTKLVVEKEWLAGLQDQDDETVWRRSIFKLLLQILRVFFLDQ